MSVLDLQGLSLTTEHGGHGGGHGGGVSEISLLLCLGDDGGSELSLLLC
jgi:Lanthionine-containing peptide SapB precursor RamS